jgi:prepilin-type N-terminal cleavage/methylation domain-containing protein
MIMMNNRRAFTLIEVLTVVTIIAVLLGILLPSVAMVRAKAKETAEKAQLNAISMALEAFKQDYGDYPPSAVSYQTSSSTSPNYCGAQELAEALLGWDLMGFNPSSVWRADGTDGSGNPIYTPATANLQARKGPYLELATANVFKLSKLFNNTGALADTNVICDVFKVRRTIDNDSTGKPIMAGAPILYYKANTANKTIDPNYVTASNFYTGRTYNYLDNKPLIDLGKLTANGDSGMAHPLGYFNNDYQVFYNYKYTGLPTGTYITGTGYGIRDPRIPVIMRPYNPDSYILISAGPDGYYGTADDIHNY